MSKVKIKIELTDYHHTCADGCCTDYGTIVKVNEVELGARNYQEVYTTLQQVLEHLGYEVEIMQLYEDEQKASI